MNEKQARLALLLATVALVVSFMIPLLGAYTGASGVIFPLWKPSKIQIDLVPGANDSVGCLLSGITASDEVLLCIEMSDVVDQAGSTRKKFTDITANLYNLQTDSITFTSATNNDTIWVWWVNVDG